MGRMGKKKRGRQSRRRGYDSSYSDSSSSDGISTEETPATRSILSMIEEAISKTISKEAEGFKQTLNEMKEELKEELKEEINKVHKELKKLNGDGSPAPRSEPNQMQPPTFSLKIECEVGNTVEKGKSITIKVKMYDGGNPIGEKLKDGRPHPLASAKVMMVVLDGNFNDNRSNWSKEDFEKSIKTSTTGDVNQGIVRNCVFYLNGGTGHHSGATITENSSNSKVKLGVMVLPDDSYEEYKNERVLEGVSEERFVVRDPPRTRKKQKEVVEHFRSPLAEQAPVGCGQERNGPTLNIPGQLQLQADTNMPSSSSTPRDNTLGADQQLSVEPSTNRQPSSFSGGYQHISAGRVQTPVISDSTNQTMPTWAEELRDQPIPSPGYPCGPYLGYLQPEHYDSLTTYSQGLYQRLFFNEQALFLEKMMRDLRITTVPKEVMQTHRNRGALIQPLEPDDSDGKTKGAIVPRQFLDLGPSAGTEASEDIVSRTAAITADPNFTMALAAAIKSIIGNQQQQSKL